jgi:hypothetical protein
MKKLGLFGLMLAVSLVAPSLLVPSLAQPAAMYDPTLNVGWVSLETGKSLGTTLRVPVASSTVSAGSKIVSVAASLGLSAELVSVKEVEPSQVAQQPNVAVSGTARSHHQQISKKGQNMPEREAVLTDLQKLRAALPQSAALSETARVQAIKELDRLEARAGSLSRAHLIVGLARIAALAHDGHTNLDFDQLGKVLPQLPLRVAWFADGLYVTATSPAQQRWLGSRIETLEGQAPARWLDALSSAIGGTPARVRARSPQVLITPAFLEGLGLAASSEGLRLGLRLRSGEVLQEQVSVSEEAPTQTLLPDTTTLLERDQARSVYQQELPNRAFYVGLRQIASGSEGPLPEALEQTLETIRHSKPERVIVDLRGNGGGNYILARLFAQNLRAAAGTARVYALTDEATFSAAIVTLAWLRFESGARIVGSGPGDDERFYAEPLTIDLSAIGTRLYLGTRLHDWNRGCTDLKVCFWLNLFYDVPAGSLQPDLAAQNSFAQFMAGQDTVLEAALRDETPLEIPPLRVIPPLTSVPPSQQGAYCGLLLGALGARHQREDLIQVSGLMLQQARLAEADLAGLRARVNTGFPTASDASVLAELHRCGAVLAPLIIAYTLQNQP